MERNNQQLHAGEKLIRVLMCTLILSAMSATMFNIVLPEMRSEFQLTISEVSWVMSAYILIYGIGTAIYGKLADSFKLKNLLTFGLLFFALGSLFGLMSQSYWMVIVGRCLQAMGASVVPATAMIIPVRYFSQERRGYALGMNAVGLALGGAIGPVISALIVSFVHWRWLFFMPLLILFTLPFYRKYLSEEQGKKVKIDWLGGGLLGGVIALLLLGVTKGAWYLVGCSIVVLGLFIYRIRTAEVPFVQPKLFKNKNYTLVLMIAFCVSGIGFSLVYLTPILLAEVHELSPGLVGFAMVPAAIASALLGKKGGRIADKRGNEFLLYIASSLLVTCFILLSSLLGISTVLIAIILMLGNVGQSFMMITISNSISRTLSPEQVGVGMGLLSMLNFIAGGMAAGIYSRIVDLGSSTSWNPLNITTNGSVFSNIYLILAAIHLTILLVYYFQFGRETKVKSQHTSY